MIESSKKCLFIIDIDGTIIPTLIDFDKLRSKIRLVLNVNHPLRPLGESLASLNVNKELKEQAWRLIEEAEVDSINRLKIDDVEENRRFIQKLIDLGIEVIFVTMRSWKSTNALIEKLELGRYVSKIITRNEFLSRREQLKYIKDGSKGKKIIFIGDTVYDEFAARELGINFIKVENYKELPRALEQAINICAYS